MFNTRVMHVEKILESHDGTDPPFKIVIRSSNCFHAEDLKLDV